MTGHADSTAAASPLGRLIGTWDFETSSQGRFLGRGWTTFEWMEDGAFVLQRADDEPDAATSKDWSDHSPMPVTAVIGVDDTTGEMVQLYSDARGVFRIYRMSLTDEAWTAWRDAPGFNQRFIGTFRDASTIEGQWETSEDGTTWTTDFDMVYRRTDERGGRVQSYQRRQTERKDRPMKSTIAPPTTHTLDVPGATLTYDIRRNDDTTDPPLMLIGSPMAAAGFVTLVSHFPDRTIVTYDPRGSERSTKDDPSTESTPDQHADDLHRVIQAVGGRVDLFASSGGATNALALVAQHPDAVRILVAHEPPIATVLPDAENAKAAARAVNETYKRSGFNAGMAHFMAITGHRGPFPDDIASQPPPDPAAFGMPTEDDGSRDDVLMAQNMVAGTHYELDFDALQKASTRIVCAAGAESEGEMANRGGHAVAERLGTEPVIFPSHHGGFLGGEYGWPGEPEAFAAKLRQVLEER